MKRPASNQMLTMSLAAVRHCGLLSVLLLCLCCSRMMAQTDVVRADSMLMQYLRSQGLPAYAATGIDIFTNGTDKFEALFSDIDHAQHKVWIEYFIFANDSIGHLTLRHLQQAAQRGVDVRLVIDDYKDHERHYGLCTEASADSIRGMGIDFVTFDPFRFPYLNHVPRDHRKIVVIDDQTGYIGGLNVADYYIVGKPSFGGWRDTHVRITGPAVEGLALLFDNQYRASGGLQPYGFAPDAAGQWSAAAHTDAASAVPPQVVYFERSRASHRKKAETRRALVAAFDAARDTIRFVTPYFLPTHSVRQAILRALDRGVHVEMFYSKVGDSPMLSYGNYHLSKRMLRHGAHIYLYRGQFHHSKIMMVDGQFSMVGSANLNSRSLRWDYEASCFIFDPLVTQRLNAIFEADKLQCDTFSLRYYHDELRFGARLKALLIDRFFTPIL